MELTVRVQFGDTFFKSWTSVFDVGNSRVGLAAAVPATSYPNVSDVIALKLKQEALTRSGSSTGGGTSAAVRTSASAFALVAGGVAALLAFC